MASEMEVLGVDNCEETNIKNPMESSSGSLRILSSPPPSEWSCRRFEGAEHYVNEYTGYVPQSGVTHLTERICVDQITPEQFFEEYVRMRRPAVFSGQLTDASWAAQQWTNRYLADKAGKAMVMVENRHTDLNSTRGTFGVKQEMQYSKFLHELDKGNENLYMTTQDLERDEGDLDDYGMPQAVAAEPLRSLQNDFPVRPTLLGNLIPYQLSLWQGTSKHGSSSGLHHDFHDNLYVLLRGRKTFRIFPPSAVGLLKPAGSVTKVHKNGLIVYAFRDKCNIVNIRADGVPLAFISRRKRDEAESELAEAEDDLLELREREGSVTLGAKSKLLNEKKRLRSIIGSCEDKIDEAIAESIRYGDVTDDEDEVISISDDDNDDSNSKKDSAVNNDDDDDDDDEVKEPLAKQRRLDKSESQSNSNDKEGEKIETDMENNFCTVKLPAVDVPDERFTSFLADVYENEVACRTKTVAMELNSTDTEGITVADESNKVDKVTVELDSSSTANGNLSIDGNGSQLPDTSNCSNAAEPRRDVNNESKVTKSVSNECKAPELPSTFGCIVVDLKPGEMLYLPASWFHEVTSFNDDKATNENCSAGKGERDAPLESDCIEAEKQKKYIVEKESCTTKNQSASDLEESVAEKDVSLDIACTGDNPSEADGSNKEACTGVANTSHEQVSKTEGDKGIASDVNLESKVEESKVVEQHVCVTDRGHLAFNYWMYPPDGSSFKRPYEGEFWPRRWYELETLRCTMGVGGSCNRRNESGGQATDDRRGSVKASSSHVINLDSDDEDDDVNEVDNSDCFPMDNKHLSDDDDDEDEDSWNFEERGKKQKRQNRTQDSCILLNDTSSVCEIVDEAEDEENSEDRSELDSSVLDDSFDDVASSTRRPLENKNNHGIKRHVGGRAIYVDSESGDSCDEEDLKEAVTSSRTSPPQCTPVPEQSTSPSSPPQCTPVPEQSTSASERVSTLQPVELLDTILSPDNKVSEAVSEAAIASSANGDSEKQKTSLTDVATDDAAVPSISSQASDDSIKKVDAIDGNDDDDDDKNLEKLLDENDDDNLDEAAVDDRLLDESFNAASVV